MEERKGFMTPDQIKILAKLIGLKGIYGLLAPSVLRLIDDLLLEKVKAKIPNAVDVLPVVYQIVDEIFNSFDVDEILAAIEASKQLPEETPIPA